MGKLLIVSTDAAVIQAMSEQFPAGDEFQVETAASGVIEGQPGVVLIDLGIGWNMGIDIAYYFSGHGVLTIIALVNPNMILRNFRATEFTHVFYWPFDPAAVAGLIRARMRRKSHEE